MTSTILNIKVGDKVKITRNAGSWLNDAIWWPIGDISGTVDRVCKNGAVRVSCDQFHNTSKDNKLSKYFYQEDLVTITVI